jgi:predicted nucleotidyltransferase
MTNEDLPIIEQLKEISARYHIGAVYAFGSRVIEVAGRVRGEAVSPQYPVSDVDIGIQPLLDYRLTAQERVRLSIELEDLLGVGRVDLVVLPEADPFLALDVIRGELLWCADADAQAEDELYILRRAGDLAPYARERWQLILSGKTK